MDDLRIDDVTVISASELSWSAVRSSGPGGQNVNKVASKVELRFDLANTQALDDVIKERLQRLAGKRLDRDGRVVIVSQLTRDQQRNLENACEKLAELVRRAKAPPKPRKSTKPSRRSIQRRLTDKKKTGEKKRSRTILPD